MVLKELRSFVDPAESCGWELQKHMSHVYVTVRAPAGGFYSSVSVETPFRSYNNHFRRVSKYLSVP